MPKKIPLFRSASVRVLLSLCCFASWAVGCGESSDDAGSEPTDAAAADPRDGSDGDDPRTDAGAEPQPTDAGSIVESGSDSCSGYAPDTSVASLSAAQQHEACLGYRQCARDRLTVESSCRLRGLLSARSATTQGEARDLCTGAYDACIAQPAPVEESLEMVKAVEPVCEPLGDCQVTIAGVDACDALLGQAPVACTELTLDDLDRPMTGLVSPQCQALGAGGCIYLVAEPKE